MGVTLQTLTNKISSQLLFLSTSSGFYTQKRDRDYLYFQQFHHHTLWYTEQEILIQNVWMVSNQEEVIQNCLKKFNIVIDVEIVQEKS